MHDYIGKDFELYEVINEFPILKDSLLNMHFRLSEIKEGDTVKEFLEKNSMEPGEIELIVKKLNRELNVYMKKGIVMKTPILMNSDKVLEEE